MALPTQPEEDLKTASCVKLLCLLSPSPFTTSSSSSTSSIHCSLFFYHFLLLLLLLLPSSYFCLNTCLLHLFFVFNFSFRIVISLFPPPPFIPSLIHLIPYVPFARFISSPLLSLSSHLSLLLYIG